MLLTIPSCWSKNQVPRPSDVRQLKSVVVEAPCKHTTAFRNDEHLSSMFTGLLFQMRSATSSIPASDLPARRIVAKRHLRMLHATTTERKHIAFCLKDQAQEVSDVRHRLLRYRKRRRGSNAFLGYFSHTALNLEANVDRLPRLAALPTTLASPHQPPRSAVKTYLAIKVSKIWPIALALFFGYRF